MGKSPVQTEFERLVSFDLREIARAFGLPFWLVEAEQNIREKHKGERKMSEHEKFQVRVEEPAINKAILDVAEKAGWEVPDCILPPGRYGYLLFGCSTIEDQLVAASQHKGYAWGPLLTIEEAIPLIKAGPRKKEEPIVIGGYQVEFDSDGAVKCSCVLLSWEQVDRLHDGKGLEGHRALSRFQVDVLCPEISEAIQKLAFEAGYCWFDKGKVVQCTDRRWLSFGFCGLGPEATRITQSDSYTTPNPKESVPQKTIEEAIGLLTEGVKQVVVGEGIVARVEGSDGRVSFRGSGDDVVVEMIAKATVDKIWKRAKAKREGK